MLTPATAPAFADNVETLLADKVERGDIGPKTANELRGVLLRTFEIARDPKRRLWATENPIRWVKRYKVPKAHREVLSGEEIPAVLAAMPDPAPGRPWRWAAAICLYTGTRPGEAFGLHKADIDQSEWTALIRWSWSTPIPKDDEERPVIIPSVLRPFLIDAINATPGPLVLAREDGSPFDPETRHVFADHLRRALCRAGIVIGYEHTCRRCKAAANRGDPDAPAVFSWQHADASQRRCERCGMKLWAKPIPRPLSPYGLRHSHATILRKRGVDLGAVQKQMGHSSPEITAAVYDHSDLADYREAIERALTLPRPTGAPSPVMLGAPDASGASLVASWGLDLPHPCDSMRALRSGAPSLAGVRDQGVAGSNPVSPTQKAADFAGLPAGSAAFVLLRVNPPQLSRQ